MAGDSPVSDPGERETDATRAPDASATGRVPPSSPTPYWSVRLKRSRFLRFGAPAVVSTLAVGIAALEIAAATTDVPQQHAYESAAPVERYHRIAAGPVTAPAFAIGRRIASAISRPVGAPGCAPLEGCGVEGLIAVATSLAPVISSAAQLDSAGVVALPGIANETGRQADAVLLPLGDATDLAEMRLVGIVGVGDSGTPTAFAWLVAADLPDGTVFAMAASVWRLGRSSAELSFDRSPGTPGTRLPDLHPGAAAFYRENAAASPRAD